MYFDAPISRLEISERSGLSPATVTNVVSELLAEGIVVESGSQVSQGGRPRTILNVNPHYGFFVGVEAGETDIRVELLDLKLTKLGERHYALAAEDNEPDQVVDHIVTGIETLLTEARLSHDKILGIGIGLPGIVDRQMGVSVFAPNWAWHNVPLLDLLTSRLKLPIYVENGAKTMALAENMFGAGQGIHNFATLLIATGVGAGIITQGQLYKGASNSAGEWGHTCIEINGCPCRCGSHGCLEAYVGALGIIGALRELDPDSVLLESGGQVQVIAAIKNAAQQGDSVAINVLDKTAHYLGAGIANIVNLFNPQVITIGGWSGLLLGDYFLNRVRPYIERYALKSPLGAVRVQLSSLRDDAVSIGAASLALEEFLKA